MFNTISLIYTVPDTTPTCYNGEEDVYTLPIHFHMASNIHLHDLE